MALNDVVFRVLFELPVLRAANPNGRAIVDVNRCLVAKAFTVDFSGAGDPLLGGWRPTTGALPATLLSADMVSGTLRELAMLGADYGDLRPEIDVLNQRVVVLLTVRGSST